MFVAEMIATPLSANILSWMASPGFHLQHISGVIDRMITYAKAETLDHLQFDYLQNEGLANKKMTTENLVLNLDIQILKFLDFLSAIDVKTLNDFQGVGRAQFPSTVGGLLFHAAEHTQRHVGQLLVTVKFLIAR